MSDLDVRAMDDARAMAAWEYLADPTPERMRHAMSCMLDGLLQQGKTISELRDALLEAFEAADWMASTGGPN